MSASPAEKILHLTRDAVCAGDDMMAPNAGTVAVSVTSSVADVLTRILSSGYLAHVQYGATWSVWRVEHETTSLKERDRRNLLGILHEPDEDRQPARFPPTVLLNPDAAWRAAKDLTHLYVAYHCCADPAHILRDPAYRGYTVQPRLDLVMPTDALR